MHITLGPHFKKMLVSLWVILTVLYAYIICSKKFLVFPDEWDGLILRIGRDVLLEDWRAFLRA